MKRYWQFLIVGIICLLVALLWAQPPQSQRVRPPAATTTPSAVPQTTAAGAKASRMSATAPPARSPANNNNNDADPLPGSSSSLPLLAVIGFGVLAGGITSAMRTR
ncbi:MAG TPA: hypothetical protein VL155_16530 [Terriglobales bacterium]|jgi:hypothetical protein|nr:hypothetical protein [Terriglobales bacterium]